MPTRCPDTNIVKCASHISCAVGSASYCKMEERKGDKEKDFAEYREDGLQLLHQISCLTVELVAVATVAATG